MKYDIAAKTLMETCRDEIIRYFLDIDVRESRMIRDLPQETVSLKRSDYPVLTTDANGVTRLVIIEIQTYWDRTVPLNLLDYRTRYLLRHEVEAVSCVLMLKPSPSAADRYIDHEVNFRYRLVDLSTIDGRRIVEDGPICLLPFVPLMAHGRELIDQADALIYGSSQTQSQKADLLTSMAILSGLASDDLPARLIARRRDIMIQSAAYDIIKQEGVKEGIQLGIEQGIEQGRQQGITQGIRQGIQRMQQFARALIEMKFGPVEGAALYRIIKRIDDEDTLESLPAVIQQAASPDEVLRALERLEQMP